MASSLSKQNASAIISPLRAHSSAGQSARFTSVRSLVQVQLRPPVFSEPLGISVKRFLVFKLNSKLDQLRIEIGSFVKWGNKVSCPIIRYLCLCVTPLRWCGFRDDLFGSASRMEGAGHSRLNAKLRGYYNYYGVYGNYPSLNEFFEQVLWLLWRQLNQRSQRKSYNCRGFRELTEGYQIEQPRGGR